MAINVEDIRAPRYAELVAEVTNLRALMQSRQEAADNMAGLQAEVTALRAQLVAQSRTSSTRDSVAPSEVSGFHVVPNINKGIGIIKGNETPYQAEDWLKTIRGMFMTNGWPFDYTLQYIRIYVDGAARDWFSCRDFDDWEYFERRFRRTFIRMTSVSDRADAMKSRVQNSKEVIMDYFQPKMRMCRDLKLDFDASKDYVLRGLLSRELDCMRLDVHTSTKMTYWKICCVGNV